MLEQGHVRDYETAEGQLQLFQGSIERLEEQYFEQLENIENFSKRIAVLESRLETDRRLIVQESTNFETNRVRLQKLVQHLRTEQREIGELMNPNVVDRFKRMIINHPQAVSTIVNNHCSHCHVMIPKMMSNDVLQREIIHNCPSCSTFLISDDEII